jgi:N-acetylglucosamine-6-sulfatase
MLTRREVLAGLPASAWAAAPSRPNLIFILIDDLRWDALGCSGHPFSRTPNIDRIAAEGVRFTNAFVTTPLCSPSRASYLTGQFVHKHGVTGNGDNAALSHRLVTFPKLLRDSGYETAYAGKWHMGTDDSPRPGFDRWVSFRGQGQFDDPQINVDGKSSQVNGYMTDIVTQHALDFVNAARSKPFCLYLAHKAVHGPFTPAARHAKDFADQPIRRAPSFEGNFAGKKALVRDVPGQPKHGQGPGSADELIRNQLRCLRSIDEGVGRIYDALRDTGRLEDTAIVFTSDNGYFWGEHRLGDKRWAYEESIRIPMLMRLPGKIPAGRLVDQFALNIDIAPTMLALAGERAPKTMQGRSLLPVMGTKPRRWRESFLSEYFQEERFPKTPSWQAVRNRRFKYIHYTDLDGMDELYDLSTDPHEMRNIIDDRGATATTADMKKELTRLLKETA